MDLSWPGVTKGFSNVRVDSFDNLLIQYCPGIGARLIVPACAPSPTLNANQIAHANADMVPTIDAIFLPTRAYQPRWSRDCLSQAT
jgi:pantetheine-phosphate adenylyltransferase